MSALENVWRRNGRMFDTTIVIQRPRVYLYVGIVGKIDRADLCGVVSWMMWGIIS